MTAQSNILSRIRAEMEGANLRYGPPASAQESMGVLLEEFHELREAIHSNNVVAVMQEAAQVAAVAARLAEACLNAQRADGHPMTPFGKRSGF